MTDQPNPSDPDQPTKVSTRPPETPPSGDPVGPNDATLPLEQRPYQAIAVPQHSGEGFTGTNLYTRGEEIGRGGMGRISSAFDHNLQRHVAIKEILPSQQSPEMNERFLREAYLTGELEHPGTVPVYSFGVHEDGRMFYAMRRIGGRSLREAIRELPGTLPLWEQAERQALLQRFLQACQAMAYAHDRGIIHRDIKPSNIMIGEFGETILLDWGAAKRLNEADPPSDHPSAPSTTSDGTTSSGGYVSPDTRAGAVIGTPAYMAPEQAQADHDKIGPTADVFSLGATLYEIVTGVSPYHDSGDKVLDAAVAAKYRRPRRMSPGLPHDLESIILKAMAPNPKDRYRDAGALVRELEQFLTGARVDSHRYSPYALLKRWLRLRRTFVTVVILIFVAIAGIGATFAALGLGQNLGLVIVWAVDAQLGGARSLVEEWLDPADGALSLAEQIAYRFTTEVDEAEVALATAATSFPSVARLYYANGTGAGPPVAVGSDQTRQFPADVDARTRPWHVAALASGSALAITGPYPDINTQEPTITLSRLIPSIAAGRETVVGADLHLDPLVQTLRPDNFPGGGAVLIAATEAGTESLPWRNAEPILVSSTLPMEVLDYTNPDAGQVLIDTLHRGSAQGQGTGVDVFLQDVPDDIELGSFTVQHVMYTQIGAKRFAVFSTTMDDVPWTVSLFIPIATLAEPFVEGWLTFVDVTSGGFTIAAVGIGIYVFVRARRARNTKRATGNSGSLPPGSSSWPSSP